MNNNKLHKALKTIFLKKKDLIPANSLYGVVGIIFGFIFLSIGIFILVERYIYEQSAFKSNGKIIEILKEDSDGDIMYRPVISFYTLDGTNYIERLSFASNPPIGKVGDEIEILYEIDFPENIRPGNNISLYLFNLSPIILGTLSIVFGVLSILKSKKYKSSHKKWKCLNCGTKNSDIFDICYKCNMKK